MGQSAYCYERIEELIIEPKEYKEDEEECQYS